MVVQETAAQGQSRLVFWLPPEEAIRHFGIAREELTVRVRTGEITMRAKVAGGRLQATLCSTDLIHLYGEPQSAEARAPETEPEVVLEPVKAQDPEPAESQAQVVDAGASHVELDQALGELVVERDRVRVLELDYARLEGRLETAGQVERGLQRYADKLEGKLEDAEQLRLNLARAMGQLEAEAHRLRSRLELAVAPALQIEAAVRPKRRSWFRR